MLFASGEQPTLRNAVALVSAQAVQGTAVTPATALGMVRASIDQQSNNMSFYGPGSANRIAVKGGSTVTPWTMNWSALQAGVKPMLLRGVRTAGLLPWFTLAVGYKDDTGTPVKSAKQIQDCKVGTLALNLNTGNAHNPLTGSMSGLGMLATELTSLNPATLTTAPYMSYEAALSDGSAWGNVITLSLNVNQSLAAKYAIPGSTPASFQRGPYTIQEEFEHITGSVQLKLPLSMDVQANTLTKKTLVLTFTNLDDSTTLVITLTGTVFGNQQQQEQDDGILWSANFECDTWGLA